MYRSQARLLNFVSSVLLMPLYSSKYTPHKEGTLDVFFDVCPGLTWQEIASLYPDNRQIYEQANRIYGGKEKIEPLKSDKLQ